ncbi:MAG: beta-class carbonic anhydrase [Acidimicrobiales bacterium]
MTGVPDGFEPNADELVAHNDAFAASFPSAHLGPEPSRRLAIVACMDARLDVPALLGIDVGEAHIIRNAGGVITDEVIVSLCLSQRVLGTREIVLVHHTDCGLEHVVEAEFLQALEAETGVRPPWTLRSFDDPAADVLRSIELLESSPFLLHTDHIRGFVYDVADGRLHEPG